MSYDVCFRVAINLLATMHTFICNLSIKAICELTGANQTVFLMALIAWFTRENGSQCAAATVKSFSFIGTLCTECVFVQFPELNSE